MSVKLKKATKSEKNRKNKHSETDSDSDSEHELSYYIDDRIKLMKEVLKILKQKKIKSMAPDYLKKLDISELYSMLLEELLGISNKRLKSILNGENLDAESSSTDSDDDPKPIDIISLDDISTDEDLTFIDCSVTSNEAGGSKQKKRKHVKTEPKEKTIKKEKAKQKEKKPISSEDKNLMSVLELLELQARARAIRSQLALEAENKKKEEESVHKLPDDSDSEVLIVSSPKNNEIVICSSESESEKEKRPKTMENCKEGTKKKYEKIYFIQSEKIIQIASNTTSGTNMEVNQLEENVLMKDSLTEQVDTNQSKDNSKSDSENDEILNIHAENEIDM